MSLLEIKIFPDPILRVPSAPVTQFDHGLHELLDNMFETMQHAEGIGLAAPQVGVSKRVVVIDISHEDLNPENVRLPSEEPGILPYGISEKRLELINPEIIKEELTISSDEGCLSIPDFRETIKRKGKVSVRSQDRNGKVFEFEASELLARCVQHEIDHIDGILFIDHLSRLKKHLFNRWCDKNLNGAREERLGN